MGSRTFDFLTESFLLDDSLIGEFRGIPESEIVGELKRYREFCLTVTPEVTTGPAKLGAKEFESAMKDVNSS
jgi:hypothetical protein